MKKHDFNLPNLMKGICVDSNNNKITIRESSLQVPVPKKSEVLVKIDYAPINPSDLVFIKGKYGKKTRYPIVPGFEGAGTIVSTGNFMGSKFLKGRRVACSPAPLFNGTWAQYMLAKIDKCVPLLPGISTFQGASLLVNPLSAWALINTVRKNKFENVIISAASSSIGKMLIKLANYHNLKPIALTSGKSDFLPTDIISPSNIINTANSNFSEQIGTKLKNTGKAAFLDCVGGKQTETVINNLAEKSKIYVFGALANSEIKLDISRLIFSKLEIEGFWLQFWLKNKNMFQLLKELFQIQLRLNKELSTNVIGVYPLNKINEAIDFYLEKRSQGKVLLKP
ncbi:MAG: alcohol dehydrogenase catalytic domain-containing protein [Myxococcota bacterium]